MDKAALLIRSRRCEDVNEEGAGLVLIKEVTEVVTEAGLSWCQLLNENSSLRRSDATTGSSDLPKNDWKAVHAAPEGVGWSIYAPGQAEEKSPTEPLLDWGLREAFGGLCVTCKLTPWGHEEKTCSDNQAGLIHHGNLLNDR